MLLQLFRKKKLSRHEILNKLREYYMECLAEDPIDGSDFDCDLMRALADLDDKYDVEY